MSSLEKAYSDIKTKFEDILEIEPLCIIKSVNEHRNFWKPNKVRILLLAESHVYTSITEYNHIMQYDGISELIGCPNNYVKLVYCLGYGENNLVKLNRNSGTWQFWRIFTSCINQNPSSKFERVEKGKTPNFNQRLRNKISVLEKLKERGIWLVDASIVAINDTVKLSPKIKKAILKISWEHHISKVILETQPKKIIVIGKGVSDTLKEELEKVNIPYEVLYQPQGIRSKDLLKRTYEKYYEYCNDIE